MLMRLMKGTGANAFGQIGIVCVQLVSVPVLSAHWGLQTYGVWLMLMTIPAYLIFGDLGFCTAAGNEMIMLVARNEIARAQVVYRSAAAVAFGMAATIVLLSAFLCLALPSKFFSYDGGPSVSDARYAVFALTMYGACGFLGSLVFAGYRAAAFYARGTTYISIIQIAEGGLLVATVYAGGSILAVSLVVLVFRWIVTILQFHLLFRHVPWLGLDLRHAGQREIQRLLKPSLAIVALSGGQIFLLLGTVLTLGAATSAAVVAVFTTTRTLIRSGVQVTGLLNRALMPEYSAAVGLHDRAGKRRMVRLSLVTSLALLVPGAVVLLAFGKEIIAFWTHGAVVPSGALLGLMIVVMVADGTWVPLSNLILAANEHASYAYFYLALSLLAVVVSFPASLTFGAPGAAAAVLFVSLVMCWHILALTRRAFKAQPC